MVETLVKSEPNQQMLGTASPPEICHVRQNEMNFGLLVSVMMLAMILGLVVWVWIALIRGTIQRRRDRETVRQQCRKAREKIMADGRIEGPNGIYRPKRWASKWVAYSHDLPAPRAQSQHFADFSEMPAIPTKKDE